MTKAWTPGGAWEKADSLTPEGRAALEADDEMTRADVERALVKIERVVRRPGHRAKAPSSAPRFEDFRLVIDDATRALRTRLVTDPGVDPDEIDAVVAAFEVQLHVELCAMISRRCAMIGAAIDRLTEGDRRG